MILVIDIKNHKVMDVDGKEVGYLENTTVNYSGYWGFQGTSVDIKVSLSSMPMQTEFNPHKPEPDSSKIIPLKTRKIKV